MSLFRSLVRALLLSAGTAPISKVKSPSKTTSKSAQGSGAKPASKPISRPTAQRASKPSSEAIPKAASGRTEVYIACSPDTYHFQYDFDCVKCKSKLLLCTNGGRYGWLGGFSCPHCSNEYHATTEDAYITKPLVYIYRKNEQPANALEPKKNSGTIAILAENSVK